MRMRILSKSAPDKRHFTLFITQREKRNELRPIHCINCGRLMLETSGGVRLVVDDNVNLDDAQREGKPAIIVCKRCKSRVTVI